MGVNYPRSLDILLKPKTDTILIREFFHRMGIGSEKELTNQLLMAQATERAALVQSLSSRLAEREALVQSLSPRLAEQEALVQSLSAEVDRLKHELDQTKTEAVNYVVSKSWRITRPLRKIYRRRNGEQNG